MNHQLEAQECSRCHVEGLDLDDFLWYDDGRSPVTGYLTWPRCHGPARIACAPIESPRPPGAGTDGPEKSHHGETYPEALPMVTSRSTPGGYLRLAPEATITDKTVIIGTRSQRPHKPRSGATSANGWYRPSEP